MGVYACPACHRLNRADPSRGVPRCGRCKGAIDLGNPPVHVDDDGLQGLVATSPVPVLVDFYADWCGPCRQLAPVLEALARAHAGELLVVKVDTDRHGRTAGRLGVQGIPALFLYRGGEVVAEAAGFRPLPQLERMVAPFLVPAGVGGRPQP